MNRTPSWRPAVPCAAALLSLLFSPVARADLDDIYTWTGGGTTDDWSDPANWLDNQAPTASAALLVFSPPQGGRHQNRQNVADPFELDGEILLRAALPQLEINGGPISMPGGGAITDETEVFGSRIINAPLRIGDTVHVAAADGSFRNPGLTLGDVRGPGSLRVERGLVSLVRASYTGTTTVTNGHVQIGGPLGSDFTEGQGDYLVRPDRSPGAEAFLTGSGTIGLSRGKKIVVEGGGVLSPDTLHLTARSPPPSPSTATSASETAAATARGLRPDRH